MYCVGIALLQLKLKLISYWYFRASRCEVNTSSFFNTIKYCYGLLLWSTATSSTTRGRQERVHLLERRRGVVRWASTGQVQQAGESPAVVWGPTITTTAGAGPCAKMVVRVTCGLWR